MEASTLEFNAKFTGILKHFTTMREDKLGDGLPTFTFNQQNRFKEKQFKRKYLWF